MAKLSNPFGFTRGPVTFITTTIYLAVITALILVQTTVPSAPKSPTPLHGINLTEAWLDLQLLTSQYHPYNSHRNDYVRDWLLLRIETILAKTRQSSETTIASPAPAYVFNDTTCNITSSLVGASKIQGVVSTYFESTNIIVYVRGSEDDQTEWWNDSNTKPTNKNGVLVNAHYDSVSTGFGATDDGVGVVSILQLIEYYTTSGNTPKNGLVLLLNNGEEDFLNGARAFSQHPMSKFVSTFLNLEGAGAGGRATLFRSTDAEVTKAYSKTPFPFGTVISGDGFQRGFIKSQTDYVVFNGVLGYRGLDVAFMEPRARYHTDQDDTRHTGKNSLWHMLSAAISTTQQLTKSSLNADAQDDTPGVWFDLFGRVFAVFQLHTLFALSITLLVAAPIFLACTMVILYRVDKLYLFSGSRKFHSRDGDDAVPLNGWRGFFRFPMILTFACAAPIALAYLLFKENPFIAHSSEWAVWSMMFSSFIFVAWFLCRATDFARPSALTRAYGFTWLFMAWWVFLVFGTILETQFKVAGTYFIVFYFASVFLTTWLSYLELFSLPKKSKYCRTKFGEDVVGSRSRSTSRTRPESSASAREDENNEENEETAEEPTEQSSLLRNRERTSFKKYPHQNQEDTAEDTPNEDDKHNSDEQEWSKSMWSSLWVIEVLILAPINLILLGQIGLLIVAALRQTGTDGSSMFLVYIVMAVFSILLLSPLVPLLHRFTWHLPIFLLLVLTGTLIYNLVAFPFSPNNRLKLFFQQQVDIDTGINNVSLTGAPQFVQEAIYMLPSAAGQRLECFAAQQTISNIQRCTWNGLPPKVVDPHSILPPKLRYRTWVNFNISRAATFGNNSKDSARFMVHGRNTRACKMLFETPIAEFRVLGSSPLDKRFPPVPDSGSSEIRLWSRTWDRTWTVDVRWDVENASGMTGKVVCLWSDVNYEGVIPAFDEAKHFAPDWVAITKAGDGLVEAFKRFTV